MVALQFLFDQWFFILLFRLGWSFLLRYLGLLNLLRDNHAGLLVKHHAASGAEMRVGRAGSAAVRALSHLADLLALSLQLGELLEQLVGLCNQLRDFLLVVRAKLFAAVNQRADLFIAVCQIGVDRNFLNLQLGSLHHLLGFFARYVGDRDRFVQQGIEGIDTHNLDCPFLVQLSFYR